MIPILFESSLISIQTRWVFVLIALLVSSYLAVKRLKRRRVNFNLFIEHSTRFLMVALIFSRVTYFFQNPDAYFPAFDWRTVKNFFSIWDQGLSFWGAFVGFLLALTFTIYREKDSIWKWYDALSVPVLVGLMIGYLGAFLGGYAYGTPTNLPWGVLYEVANVKYTLPVHPVQIYIIISIALLLFSKKWIKKNSDLFKQDGNTSLYLISVYSFIHFIFSFLRGDDTLLILGLPYTIFISGIIFLISTTSLIRRYKYSKSPSHESIQTPES